MSEKITPKPNYTNIVEPKQFIFWSIASFGLFDVIRAYRNWNHLKQVEGSNIMPFWRAVFTPLRSIELFKKIKEYSNKEGYKGNFAPINHGIAYIGILVAARVISGNAIKEIIGMILGMFGFRPALEPLKAANHYYQQIEKDTLERPMKRWHYLLIVLYIIFWGLAIWSIVEMVISPETITQP